MGSQNGGKNIQGMTAKLKLTSQSGGRNHSGSISRQQSDSQFFRFRGRTNIFQKIVNIDKAGSGENPLVAYACEFYLQVPKQLHLYFSRWCEICMAAFGCEHLPTPGIFHQERLTKSGSRRYHRIN